MNANHEEENKQTNATVLDMLPELSEDQLEWANSEQALDTWASIVQNAEKGYPHWDSRYGYGLQVINNRTVRLLAVIDDETPLRCASEMKAVLENLNVSFEIGPHTVLIPWEGERETGQSGLAASRGGGSGPNTPGIEVA